MQMFNFIPFWIQDPNPGASLTHSMTATPDPSSKEIASCDSETWKKVRKYLNENYKSIITKLNYSWNL